MLLRSSSSPILNSWVPLSRDPLPPDASEPIQPLRRSRSVAQLSALLHLSASPSPSSAAPSATHLLSSPDTAFQNDGFRPRIARKLSDFSLDEDEDEDEKVREDDVHENESYFMKRFFSCSGLDETAEPEDVDFGLLQDKLARVEADTHGIAFCSVDEEGCKKQGERKKDGEDRVANAFSGREDGTGSGSRGLCNGFNVERDGSSDSDSRATDANYRKMIEVDPWNTLLLRNYAKFLHEVKGDTMGAEKYYRRALLADPLDGDVLSLYATLIWKERRDSALAETYLTQAVDASPDNCHVLGCYASFLWELDEDEEGESITEQQSSTTKLAHSAASLLKDRATSIPVVSSVD